MSSRARRSGEGGCVEVDSREFGGTRTMFTKILERFLRVFVYIVLVFYGVGDSEEFRY